MIICFQLLAYYPLTIRVSLAGHREDSSHSASMGCSFTRTGIGLCNNTPTPVTCEQQGRQVCFTAGIFEAGACGEEGEFAHLRPLIYPDADLFVLCFSLVLPETLESVTASVCKFTILSLYTYTHYTVHIVKYFVTVNFLTDHIL